MGQEIDWDRLLGEFAVFEPDPSDMKWDCHHFVMSLVEPLPPFVEYLVGQKLAQGWEMDTAIRALYCFLLEKRYSERLNLLHFAFRIFDEGSSLPQPMIDRTPFPHEEGVPAFRCINESGFTLGPGCQENDIEFPAKQRKTPS